MKLDEKIIEIELSKQKKFSEKIYDEMQSILGGSSADAYKHIITFLNLYYNKNFTKDEFKKIITDGTQDGKIDAINIENSNVDIFDIKKSSDFDSLDIKDFFEKVEQRIFKNQKNGHKLFPIIEEKIKQIKKIKNKKINLIVIRKGFKKIPDNKFYKKRFLTYASFGDIVFLNSSNIIHFLTDSEKKYPTWKIPVTEENVIMPNYKLKNETVIKLSIKNIITQYEKGKRTGHDFFYKNVRNNKNNKKLSKSFKDSIQKYSKEFHLLHNGITILTNSFIKYDHGKITVENPQVVNGLQTISSLYKLYLSNNKILDNVKIFCKIVKADKELADTVCESSNTQLPVYIWELRAHDEIQLKLERYINSIKGKNYFFARKDRMRTPKGKIKIYLPLFIQWAYAAIFEKPWEVKNRKKDLFDTTDQSSVYNIIKQNLSATPVKDIERLCEIALFVEDKIKKSTKDDKGFLRDINFHIIAGLYRKNVSPQIKDFDLIKDILKKFEIKEKKKNPDITNTKIFSQSNKAWEYLIKKM